MTELHITVGIPGCGKTTWAEDYGSHTGAIVLSSDVIRKELTGDVEDQSRNRDLFEILHARIRTILEEGYSVIVDATNLKREFRKTLMDIALEHEVPAYAHRLFLSANYDECQRRNLGRERVVPEDVMQKFHTLFVNNCKTGQLQQEGWVVVQEAAGDC